MSGYGSLADKYGFTDKYQVRNWGKTYCEFRLISEGVASALAVYMYLERGTKVNNAFIPRLFSFL